MDSRLAEDLKVNGFPSLLSKTRWTLFLIRKEQVCKSPLRRRFIVLISKILLSSRCCALPSEAFMGGGIRFPHMNGIIVSNEARIGSNCTIFHQVTLGIAGVAGKEGAPIVGDNVMIGAGAKLIGPIKVGNDVRIGANAVVTKDVPAGMTVVDSNRFLHTQTSAGEI